MENNEICVELSKKVERLSGIIKEKVTDVEDLFEIQSLLNDILIGLIKIK